MQRDQWNIAVVDDDASMCAALARLLRAASFAVQTYSSAEAFLGDPGRREVDFLVLDVQLGGMSGLELQRCMAAMPPLPPIAFITAHDEPDTREQAERAGCVAFLRKPFPGRNLLEAIHQSLASPAPGGTARAPQTPSDPRP